MYSVILLGSITMALLEHPFPKRLANRNIFIGFEMRCVGLKLYENVRLSSGPADDQIQKEYPERSPPKCSDQCFFSRLMVNKRTKKKSYC